jgi:uncharacterized protein YukE
MKDMIARLSQVIDGQQRVVEAANRGNFDSRVELAGLQGFQKEMGQGLNQLVSTTRASIEDVVRVMAAMSEGDLTKRIDKSYEGEFAKLKEYANNTVDKLAQVVAEVNGAADSLASASEQVSATAQSLSQASSEQAAGVEETSASIEQMTASISQNTENAKVTDGMATRAAQEATEGGAAVKETVTAMKQIAKKIGIIDDIAYQTNLLALNAANTARVLPSSPPRCASWPNAARSPRRKSAKWPRTAWNWRNAPAPCSTRWCPTSARRRTSCKRSRRRRKNNRPASARSMQRWASCPRRRSRTRRAPKSWPRRPRR